MQSKYKTISERFKDDKFDVDNIKSFDFEFGLISKNDEVNKFINYVKYLTEKEYQLVERYYICSLYNDYSFLRNFEIDEIVPNYRGERLLKIINNVHSIKYTKKDFKYIIKLN